MTTKTKVQLYNVLCRYGEKERSGATSQLQGTDLMVATFRHMKKPYQLLMIPLTIWSGMEQGFFNAEYTAVRPQFENYSEMIC